MSDGVDINYDFVVDVDLDFFDSMKICCLDYIIIITVVLCKGDFKGKVLRNGMLWRFK